MFRLFQYFIVSVILITLNTNQSFGETIVKKNVKGAQKNATDLIINTKLIFVRSKIAQAKILKSIENIDSNCCEENFPDKDKLINIKKNLENCIANKCYKYNLPVYAKVPQKVIALKQIDEVEILLNENSEIKYQNIILETENISRSKDLENERNINIVKQNLKELEKENTKLKITVDKMLKNYQLRITKLEKGNKELEENFNKAYNMLSKREQKEFNKK